MFVARSVISGYMGGVRNEEGNLQFCSSFYFQKEQRSSRRQKKTVNSLCVEIVTVKRFCYLGDRLNASGGCETAVTSRVRIGWIKFREYGKVLPGRRFSLRGKAEGDDLSV